MGKVIELRRQRAAVLDQADAILSAAAAEERALTDDETGKVEGLKAEAERIQGQETLAEQVDAMRAAAAVPVENRRAPRPVPPPTACPPTSCSATRPSTISCVGVPPTTPGCWPATASVPPRPRTTATRSSPSSPRSRPDRSLR